MNQNRKIFQDINRENILKSKQNSNNQNPQLFKNETCPSLDVKTQIFEEKLKKLENKSTEIFKSKIPNLDDLNFIYNFLYHGIRFQNNLEKLESIFKSKAILSGNYQENYYSYSDNCNEGEYISLVSVERNYDLIYKTFIMPNISLVISSECNAIKTIYLLYEEWEQINGRKTKNRYSYAYGEYQVKQIIPIEMVKAVGLPAKYLKLINKEYLIEIYQNDILYLMNKYNIYLPIVDISDYNKILSLPKNYSNSIKKTKIRAIN